MIFKKWVSSILFLSASLFAANTELYIGQDTESQLLGFDTSAGGGTTGLLALLEESPGLSSPSGLALSFDGTTLYIANFGSGIISTYDINSQALTNLTISDLTACYAIAFGPDGNTLYITNIEDDFYSYDVVHNVLTPIDTGGVLSSPLSLTLSSDGTIFYIINAGSNEIITYDIESQIFTPLTLTPDMMNPGSLGQPYGSTLSLDGKTLYVGNYEDDENPLVSVNVDPSSLDYLVITNLNPSGDSPANPISLALTSEGTAFYVANYGGTVALYDIGSNTLTNITPSGSASISAPRTLALTSLNPILPVNPPTALSGFQNKDQYGLIYELVNSISWNASSSSVAGYHVYRNGTIIATLNTSTTGYSDHNIPKGIATLYSVTAFNSQGTESSAISITIR